MERLTKGDAPKVIAAKIGVDPSQVSRWRSGKSEPSAENASRLAEAYGGDRFEALAAAGHVEPAPLSEDAGAFLSKLRHPYQASLVAEAIEGDDKDLVSALEEVLETGQVSPNALAQLQRLRDEATIKYFPKTYESLSRDGKLKVARFGQGVRLDELKLLHQGASDDVETATEPATSETGNKDQEDELTQDMLDLAAREVKDHDKPE